MHDLYGPVSDAVLDPKEVSTYPHNLQLLTTCKLKLIFLQSRFKAKQKHLTLCCTPSRRRSTEKWTNTYLGFLSDNIILYFNLFLKLLFFTLFLFYLLYIYVYFSLFLLYMFFMYISWLPISVFKGFWMFKLVNLCFLCLLIRSFLYVSFNSTLLCLFLFYLIYFILLYFIYYPLGVFCFLMKDGSGMDLDERVLKEDIY